ncbi:winged helix-turn-helix transcriptional regulator [Bacillus alveayuensis]|uniref:winged helix-turn-helix transcriptional regulator n=1 Tax=Aeribacillus alveayuensis TaxID=279215 RepID=UPI0005CD2D0E|nr:helix-turn-helix domain-containing protein [Bacillus alveayuensis]
MGKMEICPRIEAAMQLLGKRWMGLIIYVLLNGPQRFGELESSLPISGKLLSERLKELEKWGIVKRHVYPEVPVRVVYELTERGKQMEPIISAIHHWAEQCFREEHFPAETRKE